VNALLERVKATGQDFEWYPTTREILRHLYDDTKELSIQRSRRGLSLLDCGAGDGKVFRVLEELFEEEKARVTDESDRRRLENWPFDIKKYAIEKSRPLIESLPSDVFIVGTEFHDQSLIDKKVDIVFSNPPYSEYVEWTDKILRETAGGDRVSRDSVAMAGKRAAGEDHRTESGAPSCSRGLRFPELRRPASKSECAARTV
jgi:type I restriction-modification system DNA methylase subunit